MTNQIKILIGIFVIIIIVGGFFIYNRLFIIPEKPLLPEKPTPETPTIPSEKISPKLSVSIPQKLEIVAYRPFSFEFSIENEQGYPEAKDVNVTLALGETSILVTPNNVNIGPGESQNFKAELNKITPGNFTLYLEIKGKPDISISKSIPLNSQIVIGLDQYHARPSTWRINQRDCPECRTFWSIQTGKFMEDLSKENIKVIIIESPLDDKVMEKINVLVIGGYLNKVVTPTEIKELKNFLNQQGGLFLVGSGSGSVLTERLLFNDLIESLHLLVKINEDDCNIGGRYTKEIIKHDITAEAAVLGGILYFGCSLKTEIPLIPLVTYENRTFYAIQYYAKGKIGVMGSFEMLTDARLDKCPFCRKINLNLIKWLATPPTPEEIETLG